MYWVRLYIFETPQTRVFVYGYATQATGTSGAWRMGHTNLQSGWSLCHYSRFFSATELDDWRQQLNQPQVTLQTSAGPVTILIPGGLRLRPRVYAQPKDGTAREIPKSFSDQIAHLDSHWQLAKMDLVRTLFPPATQTPEAMIVAAKSLLTELATQTGIAFLGNESGRFGNFEVIRYLHGTYQTRDGLSCRAEPGNGSEQNPPTFVVTLDYPLAEHPELLVGCRLFAGSGYTLDTLVFDRIELWSRGSPPVRFVANQSFSAFEVSVRVPGRGDLTAYHRHALIGQINFSFGIEGERRRLLTPWAQTLPAHLRERAASIPTRDHLDMRVGGPPETSWAQADLDAARFVKVLSPVSGEGRFLLNTPESQIEAIEFLSGLASKSTVRRCVIADPYFDSTGIQSLIVKFSRVPEVLVLTSHKRDIEKRTFWDGIRQWLGITSKRKIGVELPEILIELSKTCEQYRAHLPPRFKIMNLANETLSDQQFHDRYFLLEHQGDALMHEKEVWILKNSFSSAAKRFPLVICKAPPETSNEIADYVAKLQAGSLPRRPECIRLRNHAYPERPRSVRMARWILQNANLSVGI